MINDLKGRVTLCGTKLKFFMSEEQNGSFDFTPLRGMLSPSCLSLKYMYRLLLSQDVMLQKYFGGWMKTAYIKRHYLQRLIFIVQIAEVFFCVGFFFFRSVVVQPYFISTVESPEFNSLDLFLFWLFSVGDTSFI